MVDKQQVTTMVLKVDLKCHRCYKKVKKVLCKFPQIQDQVYDESKNTVTIKVVCCCPENIKQKIICKAGGSIERIEIKIPDKSKPEPEPEKDPKPDPDPEKRNDPKKKKPVPEPVTGIPYCGPRYPPPCYCPGPFRTCCKECYEGRPGGPCLYGQCGPPPPPSAPPCYQYDGYWGRPVCDSYGAERGCYLVHYEERPSGSCLVM